MFRCVERGGSCPAPVKLVADPNDIGMVGRLSAPTPERLEKLGQFLRITGEEHPTLGYPGLDIKSIGVLA